MFYILFLISYISASREIAGACVAIHEHLMEVSGCFLDSRPLTVHSPVNADHFIKYAPGGQNILQCLPMANKIKSILCARFFNVSKNKLPERIEACMEAVNLNLEFMLTFDTAETAAAHLIQDANEQLIIQKESKKSESKISDENVLHLTQDVSDQLVEEKSMKSLENIETQCDSCCLM